jgi:hypothetical protein
MRAPGRRKGQEREKEVKNEESLTRKKRKTKEKKYV